MTSSSASEEMLRLEGVSKRFPGVKFVGYEEFGNFHGAREAQVSAAIPAKLRAHGADAVIVGIGA